MATIKVNSTVMREKANTFKTVAKSVKGYTDDMITEVDGLKAYWEGDAAEATVKQFKNLASQFEEICKSIENYGAFLESAAQSYDTAESANAGAQ